MVKRPSQEEIEEKRVLWKKFRFNPKDRRGLLNVGLSDSAVQQLTSYCSTYGFKVWCMSAEQKMKLPSPSVRTKQMERVHELAAELHQLIAGDSTLLDMEMAELGLPPADKRIPFTPLCQEDWWSLHQSLARAHGLDNPQNGFDPERVGPTFLQGLRCFALGATLVAAELEASKGKGEKPIPMWRTDLIMTIAWLAEGEGIKVTSGEKSPFMQIVDVVYRCTKIPDFAKKDVSAYIKLQSNSRALKGEKSGL